MNLYTGTENFAVLINRGAYYMDKTSYLKNIFLSSAEVQTPLFIRPRRFGKTLNLSMIKEFCELNYQKPGDTSYQQKLFIDNGRNLAVAGEEYQKLRETIMGQFPIISVSFKGVEGLDFASAVSSMLSIISDLYEKFLFLNDSSLQNQARKQNFSGIYDFCTAKAKNVYKPEDLQEAVFICGSFIPTLAQMLHKEYDRQVIVIIDEYDVPLQKAVVAKEPYYDEMLSIIRQLSVSTFKQQPDPWLYKGIVCGCLKIAHQSVFTDANNFRVYSQNDEPYTGFFGFTEEECQRLLSDCGLSDREVAVREWYDGYRFGRQHVYCPWSLVNYCQAAITDKNYHPEPFWVNSSGNDLITLFTENSMQAHNAENIDKLQKLLDGEPIEISLKEFTTYPDLRNRVSFDVFMTMMLHTGYVTFTDDSAFRGTVKIRIPNEEVRACFKEKQAYLYSEDNPYWYEQAIKLINLLLENRAEELQSLISSMLKQFISIRNSSSELYYHGFMLGVLGPAAASMNIELTSESESGDGYTDLILKQGQTAAILELKKAENTPKARLEASELATAQIIEKDYVRGLVAEGYTKIYGIGIGFGGKDCVIKSLGDLAQKQQ